MSRFLKLDPEESLRRANDRFTDRFRHMEKKANRAGKSLAGLNPAELDRLWEDAKRAEQKKTLGRVR